MGELPPGLSEYLARQSAADLHKDHSLIGELPYQERIVPSGVRQITWMEDGKFRQVTLGSLEAWGREYNSPYLGRVAVKARQRPVAVLGTEVVSAHLYEESQAQEMLAWEERHSSGWDESPRGVGLVSGIANLARLSGLDQKVLQGYFRQLDATVETSPTSTRLRYTVHTFFAALALRKYQRSVTETVVPHYCGEPVASIEAWSDFFGWSIAPIRKRLRIARLNNCPVDTVHSKKNVAKLYTESQIKRIWPEAFTDEPTLKARVPGRLVVPGTFDRYTTQVVPSEENSASIQARGLNGHIVTYHRESAKVSSWVDYLGDVAAFDERIARLEELSSIREQAAKITQKGFSPLSEYGELFENGTCYVPRSVILEALSRINDPDRRKAIAQHVASLVPDIQRLVAWPGHWKQPIILDLYSTKRLRGLLDKQPTSAVPATSRSATQLPEHIAVEQLPPVTRPEVRVSSIITETAKFYGLNRGELLDPYATSSTVKRARSVAAVILRRHLHLTNMEISRTLNFLGGAAAVFAAFADLTPRAKRDQDLREEIARILACLQASPQQE